MEEGEPPDVSGVSGHGQQDLSRQDPVYFASWQHSGKRFGRFTAICMGRRVLQLSHSLLLLVLLFHRNVVGFHWKWWHENKRVSVAVPPPPTAEIFVLATKTRTASHSVSP